MVATHNERLALKMDRVVRLHEGAAMSVWTETPTLTGRHATLRPFVEADLPALVEAAREGDLWNIFYANVSMMKAPERWLAAALKERDVGRALLFTVETPDGEVVGTTRYMRIAPSIGGWRSAAPSTPPGSSGPASIPRRSGCCWPMPSR